MINSEYEHKVRVQVPRILILKDLKKNGGYVNLSQVNESLRKMFDWLDEHYPGTKYTHAHDTDKVYGADNKVFLDEFSFEDEEVAIHFKLVWG